MRGGSPAFVAALERAALEAGVEIRTGAPVASLEVEAQQVTGIVLESGEKIETSLVAGACSPKHLLLDLVPAPHLSLRLEQGVMHFRTRGTTAKIYLALSGYPPSPAGPSSARRRSGSPKGSIRSSAPSTR